MSVNLILTPNFEKEAKKLLKKYTSLKVELEILETQLIANPIQALLSEITLTKLELP